MVFIAWEILNDTKQYGRFGYVHAKNKEKALKRARILFWKKGYVAGVSGGAVPDFFLSSLFVVEIPNCFG